MNESEGRRMAMLIDTACTMAVCTMAKVCTDDELEAYFIVNRDRLSGQGFSYDEIDLFQNTLRESMGFIRK